jgi:hypothetical protein
MKSSERPTMLPLQNAPVDRTPAGAQAFNTHAGIGASMLIAPWHAQLLAELH